MRKMLFVLSVLLGINNAMAQEATNPFDFRNFDYQSYQIKLQKFLETLTPQEKIIFIMYQSKSSSNECELDSSTEDKINKTEDKINKIYDILKGIESITCDSYYSGKLECEKRSGYY